MHDGLGVRHPPPVSSGSPNAGTQTRERRRLFESHRSTTRASAGGWGGRPFTHSASAVLVQTSLWLPRRFTSCRVPGFIIFWKSKRSPLGPHQKLNAPPCVHAHVRAPNKKLGHLWLELQWSEVGGPAYVSHWFQQGHGGGNPKSRSIREPRAGLYSACTALGLALESPGLGGPLQSRTVSRAVHGATPRLRHGVVAELVTPLVAPQHRSGARPGVVCTPPALPTGMRCEDWDVSGVGC